MVGRLDLGAVTPSPARLRLALSTSGAWWPHDGVFKRALGRYCGLPSFYLIGAGFVKQTFVCLTSRPRLLRDELRNWAGWLPPVLLACLCVP